MIRFALPQENEPVVSHAETRTIGRFSVTVRLSFAHEENPQVANSVGEFLKNGYRSRIIA